MKIGNNLGYCPKNIVHSEKRRKQKRFVVQDIPVYLESLKVVQFIDLKLVINVKVNCLNDHQC